MKLFKSICIMAVCAILACGTTACGSDDDNDYIVEQSILSAFVHVSDISQGITADYTGVSYKITYNYTTGRAKVSITGMRLPGNVTYPTITLDNLTFEVDQAGYRKISGSNLAATVDGFGSAPVFTKFNLIVLDRMLDDAYYPAMSATYTIDGMYKCVSALPIQILLGKTTSTAPKGDTFTDDSQIYGVSFDFETKRATLVINGAKFVANMPAQDMEFRNMPYTIDNQGIIKIENPGTLIPYIGSTPYPAFPITAFSAQLDLSSGMIVSFKCNAMGQDYSVDADLWYSYKTTSF